jgi:hypothetical protein
MTTPNKPTIRRPVKRPPPPHKEEKLVAALGWLNLALGAFSGIMDITEVIRKSKSHEDLVNRVSANVDTSVSLLRE